MRDMNKELVMQVAHLLSQADAQHPDFLYQVSMYMRHSGYSMRQRDDGSVVIVNLMENKECQ